ncbi:MAG TPA: YciI family protein [Gaiellaceae bacterium]|nr:YciI family protein [Gaiellaceae bacterium]
MQYMLLIYNDPGVWESMPEAEQHEIYGRYFTFTEELRASGKMVAGDALQPTSTATSVRVRDGETLTTDGPFAETKEVLGGYYLVDVETLDEALEWAAKLPGSSYGTVEVRPIVTDYETVA